MATLSKPGQVIGLFATKMCVSMKSCDLNFQFRVQIDSRDG